MQIVNNYSFSHYLINNAETSGMGTARWINNHVKQFPIPIYSDNESPVGILVSYLESILEIDTGSALTSAFFEELIDGLVFELYFPDEIKTATKNILKHLGELKPITESMSDAEKLAVIQSEFDRLYDPTHPVRNHLETLDSVEEVRIIREALKK